MEVDKEVTDKEVIKEHIPLERHSSEEPDSPTGEDFQIPDDFQGSPSFNESGRDRSLSPS